jgi:hypothetical protein
MQTLKIVLGSCSGWSVLRHLSGDSPSTFRQREPCKDSAAPPAFSAGPFQFHIVAIGCPSPPGTAGLQSWLEEYDRLVGDAPRLKLRCAGLVHIASLRVIVDSKFWFALYHSPAVEETLHFPLIYYQNLSMSWLQYFLF